MKKPATSPKPSAEADGIEIHEVPGATPNFRTELAAQLAELVPEAMADGKLDVEKLRELLADDAADTNERFGLFWPGKRRALRAAQAPTTATLQPDPANSRDWDTTQNLFIEGDNLEVLKILQRHYHNKVKLIYIDPPYNTGKDFVYPDNFTEGLGTYLEWTRQVNEEGAKVSTNPDTAGRYHSNWLNMMYPRLKLARNLLTDDGVIFISIDDNEQDNLKKLCDIVFGEANYLNTFIWVSNLKGRQISASGAAATKEYVLCYARRGDEAGEFRASGSRLKTLMPTVYKGFSYTAQSDERGPFVLKNELYNTNSAFNEVTRPNLVYDIYYNPSTGNVKTAPVSSTHAHPTYVKIGPKQNNNGTNKYHAFRWSAKKVETETYDLAFVESPSGWKVFTKVRDVDSTALKDLVMDIITNEGSSDLEKLGVDPKWFDYPKPVDFVKLLLQATTDNDSIILDFFAGSGTTAQAVMQLNAEDASADSTQAGKRRFIMVQLPEPTPEGSEARKAGFKTIADISRKRIALAGEKIKQEAGLLGEHLDTGFRAYKLVDTHFAKWRVTNDTTPDKLTQHLLDLRDASTGSTHRADDLLTEILLKMGFSLTATITTKKISGLEVREVGDNLSNAAIAGHGDGAVLAYLDEDTKPTLEQLRALVDAGPKRLIVLEDAFHGDDELKTNLDQYAKGKGVELRTA